jgi:hypothetical protein
MKFVGSMGLEGIAIAGSSSTLTIPGYFGKSLKGYDIKIVGGTGDGQRRTITDVAEPVVVDSGVPTAVNNVLGAITITDTLKAWTFNQWVGYQVRIVAGPGVGQVRKIIGNTATVLTLGDSTTSAHELYHYNPAIFSPAISATAGTQSIYQIESSVITVDSSWATTPDATSRFRITSGAILLASSAAATPFYTLQQYDIATDTWYIRSACTQIITAVGTDGSIELFTENASIWEKGLASGGTTTTLVDSSKNWTTNQWVGYWLRICSGTGENQLKQIVSNTATTLTFSTGTAPDTTSRYHIEGFDAGIATSGSASSITDSTKAWAVNRWKNYMVKVIAGTGKGQEIPILSNTSTVLTLVKPSTFTFDNTTVYIIQGDTDKNLLLLGGQSTPAILHLEDDMAALGRWQDSGAARQGYVQYSSHKPIALASLTGNGTTATATTAMPHNLKTGYVVNVGGAITNTGLNVTGVTITVTGATTFTYSNATNGTATFTGHSTTTLTDSSKNWTTNQWTGYMCVVTTAAVTAASGLAATQTLQIASNTATTLTFVAGTAPTNGVSRYMIVPRNAIGMMANGIATGTQSTTTLQDTNISSFSTGASGGSVSGNVLTVTAVSAGYLSIGSVVAGSGITSGSTIIAFGPNTVGGIGTYVLDRSSSSTGAITVTSAGWAVNIFGGRRLKMIGSTGQGIEIAITSNTANTLTFAVTTAPVTAVTSYVIVQPGLKGVGIEMNWVFGITDSNLRGKYIIVPRGGAVAGFDRLDITTDSWELMSTTPQSETLTTGSMYAYDLENRIYFTKDATQRVYYLDVLLNEIHGAGIYPYAAGTAIIGNRMEVFKTEDGFKYLWLNRHSAQECFRQLLFY